MLEGTNPEMRSTIAPHFTPPDSFYKVDGIFIPNVTWGHISSRSSLWSHVGLQLFPNKQQYFSTPVNGPWCVKLLESPIKSKLTFRDVCACTVSLLELTVSYAVFFHWSASWSQDSNTAPDNPFLPLFTATLDLTPTHYLCNVCWCNWILAPNLGCEWGWITVWGWEQSLMSGWLVEQVLPASVWNKTGVEGDQSW